MIARHPLFVYTLLAALAATVFAADSTAACSTCGGAPAATYSVGYAAPVTYEASYAPVTYQAAYAPTTYTAAYAPTYYTTAYAPTSTTTSGGWYPGYWLGRVNRAVWGYPTTTTYYAPTYSVGYASTAYAAPACSSCSASYAPAGSTCSTCTASYAPACSTCSTCDASAASGSTCASCAASTVTQATYLEPAPSAPTTTYVPQTSTSTTATEPSPTLAPDANVPAERTPREADKPVPAEPQLQPEPKADSTDENATNLQAPDLFQPSDRAAQRHIAPVWTAVYHTASGAAPIAQPVSHEQAQRDAAGWTSASK